MLTASKNPPIWQQSAAALRNEQFHLQMIMSFLPLYSDIAIRSWHSAAGKLQITRTGIQTELSIPRLQRFHPQQCSLEKFQRGGGKTVTHAAFGHTSAILDKTDFVNRGTAVTRDRSPDIADLLKRRLIVPDLMQRPQNKTLQIHIRLGNGFINQRRGKSFFAISRHFAV